MHTGDTGRYVGVSKVNMTLLVELRRMKISKREYILFFVLVITVQWWVYINSGENIAFASVMILALAFNILDYLNSKAISRYKIICNDYGEVIDEFITGKPK